MRKSLKDLMSFALAISLLLAVPAKADPSTCQEVLQETEAALESCDKLQQSQKIQIDIQKEQIDLQAKEIASLRSRENSFWNNKMVWFVGGLVLGGVIVGIAAR